MALHISVLLLTISVLLLTRRPNSAQFAAGQNRAIAAIDGDCSASPGLVQSRARHPWGWPTISPPQLIPILIEEPVSDRAAIPRSTAPEAWRPGRERLGGTQRGRAPGPGRSSPS